VYAGWWLRASWPAGRCKRAGALAAGEAMLISINSLSQEVSDLQTSKQLFVDVCFIWLACN
jgi:hypothetical protein